jgi:hypothetical protein
MAKARQQSANQAEQLVQFRHSDAQRIANVVGWYESTPRGRRQSSLPRAPGGGGGSIRIATFTGQWSIGAAKTVRFKFQTANTAVAVNLFAAVPSPVTSGDCAVARDGTAWYLIAAVCS